MSLVEHLGEMRGRLILCLVYGLAGMVIAYGLYETVVLSLLKGPLDMVSGNTDNPFVFDNPLLRLLKSSAGDAVAGGLKLHFIGPMEVFMVKLKASFFGGMLLALPLILHQVWGFVSGGLTVRERRTVRLFLPASLCLFACGLLIAYFIMLPVVLYFLVIVSGRGLEPMLVLSKYVSLVVLCCLAFGVIFQMPLVILLLARLGLVTPTLLAKKRKYAILLMFIASAVLTPPDVVTQVMMAVPMIALYELSIVLSKLAWKRRQAAAEE